MTNDSPMQSSVNEPMHTKSLGENSNEKSSARSDDPIHGLLQSRGAVLSFVFLVAGVVGLPLLWMNPNFSRAERIIWTIIVTLYSLVILILAGGILWWFFRLLFG